MNSDTYCVILAGGVGNRFWPLSSKEHPKQFSDVFHTGKSFLRQTYERANRLFDREHIFVMTGYEYEEIARNQLPELPGGNLLLEPLRRNTAACVAYSASKIHAINPEAILVTIPSDHYITREEAYLKDLETGIRFVREQGKLLTVGIVPTRPETQYGYIQSRSSKGADKIRPVKTFTEKPDMALAAKFIESGDFFWNAGIFIWQARDILAELKKHLYDLYLLFETAPQLNTPGEQEFINSIYGQCPHLSIDFGIMEKSSNVYVLKGEFGWSDVGTWHTFHLLREKDGENNSVNSSNVLLKESRNCIVHLPQNKQAVIQGVEDLIIVEHGEYLMICHRKDEEQVKHFENQLRHLS
ncbi:MAG: mannose-1-phosphate guanylyltransferase [Culturomica sp.]|jgi:mannose-1-phosphate guanylyltransferase|nr:mannose-1-phosphate guanylyltransferase [Culturomica sp.]